MFRIINVAERELSAKRLKLVTAVRAVENRDSPMKRRFAGLVRSVNLEEEGAESSASVAVEVAGKVLRDQPSGTPADLGGEESTEECVLFLC